MGGYIVVTWGVVLIRNNPISYCLCTETFETRLLLFKKGRVVYMMGKEMTPLRFVI